LEKHKRAEAHKIIEKLGGIVSDTVTKDTDFLIAGKDAGSKLDKAKRQGIEILSEQDFESLIND
jgi:DNA ligase (NAD+)